MLYIDVTIFLNLSITSLFYRSTSYLYYIRPRSKKQIVKKKRVSPKKPTMLAKLAHVCSRLATVTVSGSIISPKKKLLFVVPHVTNPEDVPEVASAAKVPHGTKPEDVTELTANAKLPLATKIVPAMKLASGSFDIIHETSSSFKMDIKHDVDNRYDKDTVTPLIDDDVSFTMEDDPPEDIVAKLAPEVVVPEDKESLLNDFATKQYGGEAPKNFKPVASKYDRSSFNLFDAFETFCKTQLKSEKWSSFLKIVPGVLGFPTLSLFVFLAGFPTKAMIMICNDVIIQHVKSWARVRINRMIDDKSGFLQPSTTNRRLRQLFAYMTQNHNWRFKVREHFNFPGGLHRVLKDLYNERVVKIPVS